MFDNGGQKQTLVQTTNLKVHFPNRGRTTTRHPTSSVRAVDGVTLSIRRGETLGLVGESGCGKSTLGRSLLRLHTPTEGTVTYDGVDLATLKGSELREIRKRMQMVFQDPFSSLNPRMKIGAALAEPLLVHGIADGKEAAQGARSILEVVGLPKDSVDRYPHEFSGGQRQRAGIARALILNPEFIVADEAVSSLDVSIQAQIINLMMRLQQEFGLTYLFVGHDLSVVRRISDRIAVMYLGRVMELSPSGDLYDRPLHPYTTALISAVPIPDPQVEKSRERIILRGDAVQSSASTPDTGCPFASRCWFRKDLGNPEICESKVPDLTFLEPGRGSACHFAEKMGG